jgi:hypothetical protein
VNARALDRDRDAVGDELEELGVTISEQTRDERADMKDPDRFCSDEQRHAEHGLDPLLTQDRVDDVGRVDVIENSRAACSGNSPCKAATEWDPHTLLDLFLDPDRGARDELDARFIHQQDRARIACAIEEAFRRSSSCRLASAASVSAWSRPSLPPSARTVIALNCDR